jgi:hypothetical protein
VVTVSRVRSAEAGQCEQPSFLKSRNDIRR